MQISKMKSYIGELKAIEHQINVNQARTLLASNNYDIGNSAPTTPSISKAKLSNQQFNLNNTDTTACEASRSQPTNCVDDCTWRELSFNLPNQVIRVKEYIPMSHRIQKLRPMSSQVYQPSIQKTSKQDKSSSYYNNTRISMNKSQSQSKSGFQKFNNSYTHRIRTEEDKTEHQKSIQQKQNATLFDFLQGHLGELYTDEALDPYKPNMNIQQKSYDESQSNDLSLLQQKLRFKNMSDQQKIEDEYMLEKKKTREENQLYFKKLFKIQKSALNQYLQGEGVESSVIKCHHEIVNPLSAYVIQKQRENQQKHRQELNKSFIRNNKKPIFESQFDQNKKQLQNNGQTIYKNNGNNKNSPQNNNADQGNQNKSNGENNKNSQTNQQLQKQKKLMQQNAQITFLENFMKGERAYFEKLGSLQKYATENFNEEMSINSKFYYDQQEIPEQQYMTDGDLKIVKNSNVLKNLNDKLQAQNVNRSSILFMNRRESNTPLQVNKQTSKTSKLKNQLSKIGGQDINNFANSFIVNTETPEDAQGLNKLLTSRKKQISIIERKSNSPEPILLLNSSQNQMNLSQVQMNLSQILTNPNQQDKKMISSPSNKIQNIMIQMLESYRIKQEDDFQANKDQILQSSKLDQTLNYMNNQHNKISNNIQNIKQIPQLTPYEKEIFKYAKQNMIKELEACLKIRPQIVNLQDQTGKTLLHWASIRGYVDMVNQLIGYGANLNLVDLGNKMPKDLALMHNKQQIYGILQKEERYLIQLSARQSNQINLTSSNLFNQYLQQSQLLQSVLLKSSRKI